MGDSYSESSNVGRDLIRLVFSTLDRPVYWLLGIIYQLFFNVASADLFSNDTIMKFYGRVQIILGVFMMFQLAMTFLRGIVEPDSFSKDKGGGSLIKRVAMSLILITVLMPIGVGSPRNEYEKQINNNGLLFGTLYSLQHRILANNTLGRLVLGTTDSQTTYMDGGDDSELEQSARIFTSTVLKGFYRINLVPEEDRVDSGDKDPATINENRMCQDIDDDILNAYTRLDADPGEIIGMVNETCEVDHNLLNYLPVVNAFAGSKKYVFNYMPIVSTVVGVIFIFILLSFTIDVAVRAVKLAVLRLIAPIPIIAYMDPKGSGDESFKAWTKTLSSTYLDLFIRLAVVYFVIFLIQDMIVNGIVINHGTGIIGVLSLIIIWIGLFIFAKQAPKFIKDVLGLKGEPGKLFGGFGQIAAAATVGAGAIGSFNASRKASRLADESNTDPNVHPNSILNRGKHLLAGFAGGISGAATGMSAWNSAKDHQSKAVMDAIQKRNATAIQRGASGSTMFGRMSATGHRLFQGEGATTFDSDTRNIAQKKDIEKSAKDLFSYLEGKGKTDGAGQRVSTAGIAGIAKDAHGNNLKDARGKDVEVSVQGSLNEYNRKKAEALANEQRTGARADFTIKDASGVEYTINAHDAVATKIEEELAYAAGDWWAQTDVGKNDAGYTQKRETYNEAIRGAKDPLAEAGKPPMYVRYEEDGSGISVSKLKKASKAAGGEAVRAESDAKYKRQQANYNATKKS